MHFTFSVEGPRAVSAAESRWVSVSKHMRLVVGLAKEGLATQLTGDTPFFTVDGHVGM